MSGNTGALANLPVLRDPIDTTVYADEKKQDGSADKTEVFASGWLTPDGEYTGRPVDVAMLRDGSLTANRAVIPPARS